MSTATCTDNMVATHVPACGSMFRGLQFGLTQPLYENFRRLIYDETGIWLGDSRKALLCGRLSKRLRALQLTSLAEYYEVVRCPDQDLERVLMIDAITTNATHFFREPQHFELLVREIIPGWKELAEQRLRSREIRIWSAGCSSGEEPYSLAMLMADHLPSAAGWAIEILATDISTRMLERACQGIYSVAGSKTIPKRYLHQFALKGIGTKQGSIKMAPELRQMVQFGKFNLAQDTYPLDSSFDLIFCRNVLIYFDNTSKQKVVDNLARCLSPSGLLIIGHAENVKSVASSIRSVAPTVYRRTDNSAGITLVSRSR